MVDGGAAVWLAAVSGGGCARGPVTQVVTEGRCEGNWKVLPDRAARLRAGDDDDPGSDWMRRRSRTGAGRSGDPVACRG